MNKNNFFIQILAVLAVSVLFFSCIPDDEPTGGSPVEGDGNYYIINYGNYGGTKSEISILNPYSTKINNTAFKDANGIELNSNVQSAGILNGKMYLMSNNGDKIDILDAKTLKVIANPIYENISKPRYFAAKDTNTVFVSCWGEVNDWTKLANSYIARIDLNTRKVTKIPLQGGPEGVIIVDDKLYIALAARNKIAVMNIYNNNITFIDVPAIAQHFIKTYSGRLYASIVSKPVTPFPKDSLGIIEINTETNKIVDKIPVPGISDNGEIHYSLNRLYLIAKEPYPDTKSTIYTIDIKTNELSSALISGDSFTGIRVDGVVGKIFILQSPSATEPGKVLFYDLKGNYLAEKTTGIYPQQILEY